jgi:hypothetical protein
LKHLLGLGRKSLNHWRILPMLEGMADELPIVTGPARLTLDINRQQGRGGNPRAPKARFVAGKPGSPDNGRDDYEPSEGFADESPTELVQALDRMRTVGDLNPPTEETTRKILRGQLYYQRLPAPSVELQGEQPLEPPAPPSAEDTEHITDATVAIPVPVETPPAEPEAESSEKPSASPSATPAAEPPFELPTLA